MFLVVFMQLLYGCTLTISKILIGFANPIFVIAIRMLIAGALLTAYATFIGRKKKVTIDAMSLFYIAQIGVIGIYLPYVLRYWALSYLPVIKAALIYNLAPFVSFFFSYLFFKEKATKRKWCGLLIGFVAIIPVLVARSQVEQAAGIGFLSWPEIAMLVSVSCFSYCWVVMKKLVMHTEIPAPQFNGLNMLIGGTCAMGTAHFIGAPMQINEPSTFFLWLGLIILVTNFICYNLYAHLLKRYSATLLSLAGLLAPVSAAVTSWLYFNEAITWDAYLSGFLVMVGFLVFYSEELKIARSQQKQKDEETKEFQEISED
ncbi:DMT family transporter [Candidatus Babeliales bacterium]|nr:DMT family transporter [Candidatus Babeliales bacterium]